MAVARSYDGKPVDVNDSVSILGLASSFTNPNSPLGSAGNFDILGASTVTSTGASVVSGGDLGLSPGTSVTGFPPGVLTPPAAFHVTDAVAAQAQLDLTAAFNSFSALAPTQSFGPGDEDFSAATLGPGVYACASSAQISAGTLTLNAGGNPNARFVFQIASTLTLGTGTSVVLTGGAQAGNVFWIVGSSATIGTTAVMRGNILAQASITLNTGATLDGRALARTAAVTLDTNAVTSPAGGAAPVNGSLLRVFVMPLHLTTEGFTALAKDCYAPQTDGPAISLAGKGFSVGDRLTLPGTVTAVSGSGDTATISVQLISSGFVVVVPAGSCRSPYAHV